MWGEVGDNAEAASRGCLLETMLTAMCYEIGNHRRALGKGVAQPDSGFHRIPLLLWG